MVALELPGHPARVEHRRLSDRLSAAHFEMAVRDAHRLPPPIRSLPGDLAHAIKTKIQQAGRMRALRRTELDASNNDLFRTGGRASV